MTANDAAEALTAARITELLGMRPLPVEGGMLAQTWQDETSSAITFLLEAPDYSGLHVLPHVEIWFYHGGAPTEMLLLHPDGRVEQPVLGLDLEAGQRPQVSVPPGVWVAAEPLGEWSLLGTYMSPPYVEHEVVFAVAAELAARYPRAAARIERVSRF